MSARPRFFLVPGIAVEVAHRAADLTSYSPALAGTGVDTAGWRLLGGNNRELGRSARIYAVDEVWTVIEGLQASAHKLTITVSPTPRGKWFWGGVLAGERVAISARTYGRQRECRYNAEQFLLALPLAVAARGITPDPDAIREQGPLREPGALREPGPVRQPGLTPPPPFATGGDRAQDLRRSVATGQA
jgi:hypothetical protein